MSGAPQPGGERRAGERPAGERRAGKRPAGERPAGERPAGERRPAPGSVPAREREPGGPLFWVGAAFGLAIVAFGVAGLLRNVHGVALFSWAKLFIGGLVVHDGIVAPATAVVGLLLVQRLPAWLRAPLSTGLVVSLIVLVVAFPLVGPDARLANNPSLLPQDYDRNLLLVLGAVWLATALLAARGWRARRDGGVRSGRDRALTGHETER